jgi:hypothetical protein
MLKRIAIPILMLAATCSLPAVEVASFQSIELNQWRVRPAEASEFANKRCENKKLKWHWSGAVGNAYKKAEVYAHTGSFVYYMHFHVGALPEKATPIVMINHLAPNCELRLNGKTLDLIKQTPAGDDPFDTEYWFAVPADVIRQDPSSTRDNNRMEIWAPAIDKKGAAASKSLARIVFENPDRIAERERRRKLRYPYLHEVKDCPDPYVARHW